MNIIEINYLFKWERIRRKRKVAVHHPLPIKRRKRRNLRRRTLVKRRVCARNLLRRSKKNPKKKRKRGVDHLRGRRVLVPYK